MDADFYKMKVRLRFLLVSLALWACEGNMEDMGSPDGAFLDRLGGSSEVGVVDGGSGGQEVTIPAGQITAGEWNDLENWSFWGNLMNQQEFGKYRGYWGFGMQHRVAVSVVDNAGQAVIDVPVALKQGTEVIWMAKTDNKGRAELWSNVYAIGNLRLQEEPLILDIQNGTKTFSPVKAYAEGINTITYSGNALQTQRAEIAFVVDATGSMGDELEYLKVELNDVIQRVKNEFPSIPLFTGSVFYRDVGDDYVTRESPFTADINQTMGFIQNQSAEGGGDYPEAVHTAMEKAIQNLQWSSQAKSRLLFLVLDAPPHHRPDVIKSLQASIKSAASKGIKVIPVTASGIDKETEFLMRFFAMATNGTYVFITNHSGIGNDHLEPTVGDYEVEFLNDLMVRLINESLE
ncbi:vWA domain-containing protein [Pararhodonellum marinum]|uniref:vWA domain-containing protein n=1 Tax=Pararhodonellum marinum TaxID=2755358 RepID=UPI00188E87CE|nr:vWA domain-containing protein [Pararhodonellum marinum]